MVDINKNLLKENISIISRIRPYFSDILKNIYFNEKLSFNIDLEDDFNLLANYIIKIKGKYEIIKLEDNLFIPVERSSNRKIHSSYNPKREAIKIEEYTNNDICFEIFGIGFLYSLYGLKTISNNKNENINSDFDIIENKKNTKYYFILIDFDLDLFLLACCYMEIYQIFLNNNIHIYIKGINNYPKLKSFFINEYANIFNPILIDKIVRKENINCLLQKNLNELEREWDDFRKEVIFNIKSFIINFKIELGNTLSNINSIISNKDIVEKIKKNNNIKSLKKEYYETAIIVGASPSLDKISIKDELIEKRKVKSSFVICVDNAINFFLANKILPDLIIILDSRNILSLMLVGLAEEFKKIPVIVPLSVSKKVLKNFNNIYLFSLKYFEDIIGFVEAFIMYRKEKELKNINFQKIINKLNLLGSFFCNIPLFSIEVQNVGAFSYLVADYLGFKEIKTYGIDFSMAEKKYYYSNSYFYNFHNTRQTYLSSTQNKSVITCIKKGERFLFEKYQEEWEKIKEKKLEIFFEKNTEKDKKYLNNREVVQNYFFNIVSYYYFKYSDKEKSQRLAIEFLIKYTDFLFC